MTMGVGCGILLQGHSNNQLNNYYTINKLTMDGNARCLREMVVYNMSEEHSE